MSLESSVPKHIAIVMDGNGRWAKKRLLPRVAGHKQGVEALRRTVQACIDRRVSALSVFAFSSENWSRPAEEVSGLMELLALALSREVPSLHERGVQIHFPGDKQGLSVRVVEALKSAENLTRLNRELVLSVCFNYGGRWDICQAAEGLRQDGFPITEQSMSERLALSYVSDPDLFIRTGGEFRISNFLMWQMAYSELYFSAVLWPDFDATELDRALATYGTRERRFGRTSEQLACSSSDSGGL